MNGAPDCFPCLLRQSVEAVRMAARDEGFTARSWMRR